MNSTPIVIRPSKAAHWSQSTRDLVSGCTKANILICWQFHCAARRAAQWNCQQIRMFAFVQPETRSRVDWLQWAALLGLMTIGVLFIYSATLAHEINAIPFYK